jgi:hypothetical protein
MHPPSEISQIGNAVWKNELERGEINDVGMEWGKNEAVMDGGRTCAESFGTD